LLTWSAAIVKKVRFTVMAFLSQVDGQPYYLKSWLHHD